MKIKIFADGAGLKEMLAFYRDGSVQGFTTNPTLMRKAEITNYEAFAREVLATIQKPPVSFEVFSDDLPTMERQALKISTWGSNVYVKIPVTNTQGVFTGPILRSLSQKGVKLNVTAVFTLDQVRDVVACLSKDVPSVISVFAGRIANAGVDPMPIMRESVQISKVLPKAEVLWASPREALNVLQAEECGCHIITVTPDILKTVKNFGKSLTQFSLETVQMFYQDAQKAGYTL